MIPIKTRIKVNSLAYGAIQYLYRTIENLQLGQLIDEMSIKIPNINMGPTIKSSVIMPTHLIDLIGKLNPFSSISAFIKYLAVNHLNNPKLPSHSNSKSHLHTKIKLSGSPDLIHLIQSLDLFSADLSIFSKLRELNRYAIVSNRHYDIYTDWSDDLARNNLSLRKSDFLICCVLNRINSIDKIELKICEKICTEFKGGKFFSLAL